MAAYYAGQRRGRARLRRGGAGPGARGRRPGGRWRWRCITHGWLLVSLGQYADGRPPLEESLALFRAVGDLASANRAFGTLGRLALGEGDLARARAIFTQARAEDERQGAWRALGYHGDRPRRDRAPGGGRRRRPPALRRRAAALPRRRRPLEHRLGAGGVGRAGGRPGAGGAGGAAVRRGRGAARGAGPAAPRPAAVALRAGSGRPARRDGRGGAGGGLGRRAGR